MSKASEVSPQSLTSSYIHLYHPPLQSVPSLHKFTPIDQKNQLYCTILKSIRLLYLNSKPIPAQVFSPAPEFDHNVTNLGVNSSINRLKFRTELILNLINGEAMTLSMTSTCYFGFALPRCSLKGTKFGCS